ncbi:MAG TPA: DUF2330 domain-containing protein [Polyangiaceae bacterium]|nr:DUF2330 domain-containing protein [Polyangiaceae bacterium]
MTQRILTLACAAAIAGVMVPDSASACGGCFAPTGSPTVVTRHQMAISMSMEETTLWDQIEYAGDPDDFVWVLPVRDGAPVELAENAFFEALEQVTQITLQAPTPPRTFCGDPCGSLDFASAGAPREDDGGGGVTVHYQAAIGPYETATIGSEDPGALVGWLNDNGYTVPEDMLPIIAHYTDLGMDFAVLRLSPNFGVNQMQPVRVTMPGINPTFPLRMVAAGVEGSVGLELFVFAEGRYGPMNFAEAEVDREALSYDWNSATFNYDELYEQAQETEGGRVWITEFAQPAPAAQIRNYQSYDDGGSPHRADEDWAVVERHLAAPYLTRLTADLSVADLGEDLVLGASLGADLGGYVVVTRETNRPADVSCSTVCDDPYGSGSAGGWRGAGRGDGLCSVSAGRTGSAIGLLGLFGAALAFGIRRRR